ncbi:MAG: YiiX/YebB-like N1pC/P60 family cysteine hydrolase [Kofleriaceae bacterium]
MKLAVVTAVVLQFLAGCSHASLFVKPNRDPAVNTEVTTLWADDLRSHGRNGDWLLTRAYYATSDLIVIGTAGEDLSHASMYDATRGMVIEAVGSGVRETELDKFLARNHFVIVVRPSNMTAAEGDVALARARSKLGTPFDASGMFGLDNPDRFYCSELVYWASETEARSGRHERIVTPGNLMKYGEVVYWSGKRDDPQVVQLAHDRRVRSQGTTTATK